MTLNSSGPISLGGTGTNASVNLELGQSATAQISMNDANVRTLAAVPSGAIIIPTDFYGKSNTLAITISPASTYTTRTGSGSLTSSTSTGSASGGAGGYSYAWTYVSGDSFTINTPSTAATTFTTSLGPNIFKSGTYRCTVTDSASATASADTLIELESI